MSNLDWRLLHQIMATPAGLLLASPPVISGVAAMAACAAMAVFYVAVLYAPTVILRFPPPTSLRTFLHRRFACAAVASAASVLATASLLRVSAPALLRYIPDSSCAIPEPELNESQIPHLLVFLLRSGASATSLICLLCSALGRITW